MISLMRPGRGDITTTRSASSTASGIEWVTNRMVFGRYVAAIRRHFQSLGALDS